MTREKTKIIRCENCFEQNANYDCNGLKFCDWHCFKEWDKEERERMDQFAKEYEDFYLRTKPC